jgi:hypothetical protein
MSRHSIGQNKWLLQQRYLTSELNSLLERPVKRLLLGKGGHGFDPEKQRSGPAAAGHYARNPGQGGVLAVLLRKASGHHLHFMRTSSPEPDQARTRFKNLTKQEVGLFTVAHVIGPLLQMGPRTEFQSAERLFLDAVSQTIY